MDCDCKAPDGADRTWMTADGLHLDVRGLEPPEPMVEILRLLEGGAVSCPVIVHLDRDPIFLYPELDERGWAHERIVSECGDPACADEIKLRLTRWG